MKKIYVSSKVIVHGPFWKRLRQEGWPIISTWIDECDPGDILDWPDLWARCLSEVVISDALLAYREPGEVLNGGLIEIGAALAMNIPVYGVGIDDFSISKSGRIRCFDSLEHALCAVISDLDLPELPVLHRS